MTYAADLHVHSRYAYATSKALDLNTLARYANIKGIDLLASADFTHPVWLDECRSKLVDAGTGVFEYGGASFILGTEIECGGVQGGRTRRVHVLIFAPGFDAVDRVNAALARYGRLDRDGRPAVRLLPAELLALIEDVDERCFLIPAHLWTPWFGLYGSKSGYDSLEECFGSDAGKIFAVETGLSSDPAMNWAAPSLDGVSIVSFSDAHSAPNLGRELTIMNGEMTYDGLLRALQKGDIAYTIEFYPQEGKYHDSGHRACGVRMSAREVRDRGETCPSCGRAMTLGVSYQVEQLGGRPVAAAVDDDGFVRADNGRPPFKRLAPLREILAESIGAGVGTKKVRVLYDRLVERFGTELAALMDAPISEIDFATDERTAEGIDRARRGAVEVEPGYDGVYGKLQIWPEVRKGG